MKAFWILLAVILVTQNTFSYELTSVRQVAELANRAPDIKKAASQIRSRDAEITLAYDSWIPDILINTGRDLRNDKNYTNTEVIFTLFNRSKDINSVRLAKWNKEIAEGHYLSAKNQATLTILKEFLNLQVAKYEVKLLNEQRDEIQNMLKRTVQQFKFRARSDLQVKALERIYLSIKRGAQVKHDDLYSKLTDMAAQLGTDESLDVSDKEPPLLNNKRADLRNAEELAARAIELSPKIKMFDAQIGSTGPKRWLALSDQFPKVTLHSRYGSYVNTTNAAVPPVKPKGWATYVNVAFGLPIIDLAFNLGPTNRVIAEEESRYRIDRGYEIAYLKNQVRDLLQRYNDGLDYIKQSAELIRSTQAELTTAKRLYGVGTLSPYDFASALANYINERLLYRNYIKQLNRDYIELTLLTEGNLDKITK